jgi:hypothetical protein
VNLLGSLLLGVLGQLLGLADTLLQDLLDILVSLFQEVLGIVTLVLSDLKEERKRQ